MNEEMQVIFALLVQIALWIRGLTMPVTVKFLLYALIDACMLSVIMFQWFAFQVEWENWRFKLFGVET